MPVEGAEMTAFLSVVVAIGMGLLGVMLRRQDNHRDQNFGAVHAKLSHIDECMDDLKEKVLGSMATRQELKTAETEVLALVHVETSRLRSEIGRDTSGLHERLMRLENLALKSHPG